MFKRTLVELVAGYRMQPPPTLERVRAAAAGTPAETVLEEALTQTVSRVRERFLPTARLRDMYAGELAAVGRDPLALSYAYAAIGEADEASGQLPPHGYVRGGTGVFSRLLGEAVEEAGVKIYVDQEVERFLIEGGIVIGVRLADGTEVRARVVCSNLDPKRTFLSLFEPDQLEADFRRRVADLVTHVSCVKLLAAISEPPQWKDWDGDPTRPWQGSVRLHSSGRHVAAMYDDLESGQVPREMVISFSLPSAVDPSLAPAGYHTASCWIFPAPAKLAGQSWDEVREPVAEQIIDQISGYAPNFRDSIINYKLRTPDDLERENGLTDGSIWHVQHTGEQLLWNRPLPELAHYRAPLGGLYLCGAGQHPGGEISGQPGHNAAHQILNDLAQVTS